MRDIPTEANKRFTKKRPGRTAKETFIRKPTSCDTCLAEADVRDEGHSARRICSLRRFWDGNETGSASVSLCNYSVAFRGNRVILVSLCAETL